MKSKENGKIYKFLGIIVINIRESSFALIYTAFIVNTVTNPNFQLFKSLSYCMGLFYFIIDIGN